MPDDLDAPVTRRELLKLLPNLNALATKADLEGLDRSMFSHLSDHPKPPDPGQLQRIEQRVNDWSGKLDAMKRRLEEFKPAAPPEVEKLQAHIEAAVAQLALLHARLDVMEAEHGAFAAMMRDVVVGFVPTFSPLLINLGEQLAASEGQPSLGACAYPERECKEPAFVIAPLFHGKGSVWGYRKTISLCYEHRGFMALQLDEKSDVTALARLGPPPSPPEADIVVFGSRAEGFMHVVQRNGWGGYKPSRVRRLDGPGEPGRGESARLTLTEGDGNAGG